MTVSPGSRWGIVGENGRGKSTLLHVLAGLLIPDDGAVQRVGTLALATQEMPDHDERTVGAVIDEHLAAARAAMQRLDEATEAMAAGRPGADQDYGEALDLAQAGLASAAGEDDAGPVRREDRREIVVLVREYRPGVVTVGFHHPDRVVPAEHDHRPVRREPGVVSRSLAVACPLGQLSQIGSVGVDHADGAPGDKHDAGAVRGELGVPSVVIGRHLLEIPGKLPQPLHICSPGRGHAPRVGRRSAFPGS
ncbi:ATP-binding cassette domain-containing protein [Nocardia sp. NPDC058497]|uniref:ATP-binding cassette domain-containing protein n=1 Tax=Nocardia sp. NPDC058497 TaxID=3346529 RepID=UPI003650EB02